MVTTAQLPELPFDLERPLGREHLVGNLLARILDDELQVVELIGSPQVGKTVIATELENAIEEDGKMTAVHVDLSESSASQCRSVAQVAKRIFVALEEKEDLPSKIVSALQSAKEKITKGENVSGDNVWETAVAELSQALIDHGSTSSSPLALIFDPTDSITEPPISRDVISRGVFLPLYLAGVRSVCVGKRECDFSEEIFGKRFEGVLLVHEVGGLDELQKDLPAMTQIFEKCAKYHKVTYDQATVQGWVQVINEMSAGHPGLAIEIADYIVRHPGMEILKTTIAGAVVWDYMVEQLLEGYAKQRPEVFMDFSVLYLLEDSDIPEIMKRILHEEFNIQEVRRMRTYDTVHQIALSILKMNNPSQYAELCRSAITVLEEGLGTLKCEVPKNQIAIGIQEEKVAKYRAMLDEVTAE